MKVHKNDLGLLNFFEPLEHKVGSLLPNHEVETCISTKKITVTLAIRGNFLQKTRSVAKDLGFEIADDGIMISDSGNDPQKIRKKLAKKVEEFMNSTFKRSGSDRRVRLAKS